MKQDPLERRFKRLAAGANRKAKAVGAYGHIDETDLFSIYLDSNGRCAYCQIGIDPMGCSFDHVIPFDRGGDNVRGNLQACCLSCQREKFTKTPEEYEQWQALTIICSVCGKEFRPRWADYQRGLGKYCSRRCSGSVGGSAS